MRTVSFHAHAGIEKEANKQDLASGTALATAFLGLYLGTLCPSVSLGDPGDFCTAIVTGGAPRPPGYPLFSLLGRAALALIPFGEPVFRIGCVAALAGALTVAALYFLAREIGGSPWASATGAAAFGVSDGIWSQATRFEVYSLHALLVTLLLLAGLRYRRTGRLPDMAAMTLAGSLGLAHHLMIVLTGPALLMLCGRRLWADPGRATRFATLAALLPTGPALYLPLLWAPAAPLHTWGPTVTLPLLWNQASAHIFLGVPNGPALSQGLAHAGALFQDNFPYLTFALPVVGAALLWTQRRAVAAALLLSALAVAAFNLCYPIADIASYYLSIWMVAAAFMAIALDRLRALACGPRPGTAFAALCSLLLIGAPLRRNWNACDQSRATWARGFARSPGSESVDGPPVSLRSSRGKLRPALAFSGIPPVSPYE